MTTCLRGFVVGVVMALVACASDKGAQQKAVAAPATTTAAGLADGAWLSYDERGAYGPYAVHHLDVMTDQSARCLRRTPAGEDTTGSVKLTDAERSSLEGALTLNGTLTARSLPRDGTVTDVGTTTLTILGKDGRTVTLVADTTHTIDPPQVDVFTALAALLQECLRGTP